jgi:hypothetical protein
MERSIFLLLFFLVPLLTKAQQVEPSTLTQVGDTAPYF